MKRNTMTLRTIEYDRMRAARRSSGFRLLLAGAGAAILLGLFAGGSGAGMSDYSGTLYLTKTSSSIGAGNWQLLTSTPSPVDATSQNRVNFSVTGGPTGYVPFAPGVSPCGTCNNVPSASISVSSCTGWMVDGSGGMTFPAGTWTFRATVEDPNNSNGQARLTAALYVVDASGSITATVVSPTDGSTNLIRSSPPATTTETISALASAFTLSASQHLCLMFWRHQTTGYTSGGAATRLFKLDVNDGTAAITSFPAPDSFPSMTLASTPADGSSINATGTVTLGATYSDPENEAGSVTLEVCPTSACATQQATTTFNGVASGSSVSWSPSLPDGTWYWRASGTDTVGGQSWSATHSFILDTTVPTTPTLVTPADGTTTNSLDLKATFSDPTAADTGTVQFQLCSDALCSIVVASGSSSSVSNNATATWTITPAPIDGSYAWEARGVDAAGNASGWSASRSVTFDRTAPTTTITANPPAPSTSSNASFSFSASESASFECNLDGAGWGTSCTSPQSYAGLADGSHTFQVRGTDAVGNVESPAASYTWSIDTTVPSSPTLSGPADGALVNAVPALGGSFTDPTGGDTGVIDFRICTSPSGAGTTCSALVQSGSSSTVTTGSTGTYTPSGIADGTYNWQARAHDTAGNQSGWTATRSFTLDSTPPDTSIGPTEPPSFTTSTTATFDFSASEVGSTFKCSLDGGALAACTSPITYSALSEATHTFTVEATDTAGNTDPSPATYSWTVDVTPPDTSIGPTKPAAVATSSSATFDFSANESATFECGFDGAGWTSCSSPRTYNGLAEAHHTLDVRATDLAGNVDATPATYTWYVDTSVPSTSLGAPNDGFATNTVPQFRATFTDPNSSDTGTVEFRICSAAAAAGTACSGVVDDTTSAVVASGATASHTPASLPNALLYWQARAQDSAGNQSQWTATRSLIYDTNVPDVPVLQLPANDAWTNSTKLTATFNEPAFAGTGWVEFRICSDGACLAVPASANSPSVSNGAAASWDGAHLVDGYYWWEARAHDAAGNVSAWSGPWGFRLDATPPAAPTNFNGTIGTNGLTLRWDPPVDTIANFVVYVNGDSGPYVGGTTYEYNVGAFDPSDARTFSVRAVDRAGNFGAMSTVLVGVPDLVGLTFGQAQRAAQVRGLVVRSVGSAQSAGRVVVVAQDPAAGSVEERGSAVRVVLKDVRGAGSPFTARVVPTRVACARGSVLRAHLRLSATARVRARMVGTDGRVIASRRLGRIHAGDAAVSVRLPKRAVSKVVFVAVSDDSRVARATVRVSPRRSGCGARR